MCGSEVGWNGPTEGDRARAAGHRADGHRGRPPRPGALGDGDLPSLAEAGRPDDRGGAGVAEDGPRPSDGLRPDARAEVGGLDGRVRLVRRHVQQLRRGTGRRHDRARGHLRAGLPAPAGDVDVRDPPAPREDLEARDAHVRPEDLAEGLRGSFEEVLPARGEVTVTVDRDRLLDALRTLRDQDGLQFSFLADVSCTDWPGRDPRLWIAYHLRSQHLGQRVRVKVGLPEEDLRVASAVPVFPAAEWQGREVYDMFGVHFDGHPDLRRVP